MMAVGMDRKTGKRIEGTAYLRQRILDVLETPIGTRVMNRDYGSRLFELVDNNTDSVFRVEVIAAVAESINRWVPDFQVERVVLAEMRDNGPVFDLYGVDAELGRVVLEGV